MLYMFSGPDFLYANVIELLPLVVEQAGG